LVAVTGYAREEDREEARRAGFDHYLVKPVDIAAVKTSLGGAVVATSPDRAASPKTVH
jgi:CheY-like chemotaxis protein